MDELPAVLRSAFARPEREGHYAATDLLVSHVRKLPPLSEREAVHNL